MDGSPVLFLCRRTLEQNRAVQNTFGARTRSVSFSLEVRHATDLYSRCEARQRHMDWLDPRSARCQLSGRQAREALETLRITLAEAIEFNRQEARGAAGKGYEELPIAV